MEALGKRWALVGPGAIGLNYTALLQRSGVAMHVLARSDYSALKEKGILLRMVDLKTNQPSRILEIAPTLVTTDADTIGSVDCVIIAAKSTVNADLVDTLKALVEPEKTVLLTLQNGMGNVEFLAKYFPENPILAGLCFVCVNRVAPAVVENYMPGRVEIGSYKDSWLQSAEHFVAQFNQADIDTKLSPVLDASMWRKLCWNIPFNGLSIVGGCVTTDLILVDSRLRKRAARLMEEVRAAAGILGHVISDSFIQKQFDVTETMGAYRPSSLIDFVDGRAVEVETIWGEALARGRAVGAAMPELASLYEELRSAVAARDARLK